MPVWFILFASFWGFNAFIVSRPERKCINGPE